MAAFQLRFRAVAINVVDRHGPSNKMRCQLKPKKAKLKDFAYMEHMLLNAFPLCSDVVQLHAVSIYHLTHFHTLSAGHSGHAK